MFSETLSRIEWYHWSLQRYNPARTLSWRVFPRILLRCVYTLLQQTQHVLQGSDKQCDKLAAPYTHHTPSKLKHLRYVVCENHRARCYNSLGSKRNPCALCVPTWLRQTASLTRPCHFRPLVNVKNCYNTFTNSHIRICKYKLQICIRFVK